MNLDNDYDNDGNNIVPCPICLSNYCPIKEGGKCPEEDMFALEGEIRMLFDEYKPTDELVKEFKKQFGAWQTTSDQPYPMFVEWFEREIKKIYQSHHQELQKARAEQRAFILQELALRDIPDEDGGYPLYTAIQISNYLKSEWRIKPDQSELDQPSIS